jgi:hypothetical protein
MALRHSLLLVTALLVGCTAARRQSPAAATMPPPADAVVATPVSAALGPPTATSSPAPSGTTAPAPLPRLDRAFFDRADLVYSSSIGSWPLQDGRYDGQYMLNYQNSCPACVQLARAAKIPVISWAVWDTFADQLNPAGQPGTMTAAQFTAVIAGLRQTLGAYPFIRFQPNNNGHSFCPESWGVDNLLAMDEEVVRTAGDQVQLYEIANEPDLDCGYATTVAGAAIAHYWLQIVPALKKYARAQGFEIYVGGPAVTTTNISDKPDTADIQMIDDFLQTLRSAYDDAASPSYHDADVIPSFVTFHQYGIEYVNNMGGDSTPLDAIPYYGAFIDTVHASIASIWGDVAPTMKVVVSEWNVGAEPYAFPEPLSATYYTQYLQMLRCHDVFIANQFLLAGNNDGMDMITEAGTKTPYYEAFKTQALTDPVAIQSRIAVTTPALTMPP